jgi:hypothetical protein
MTIGIYKLTHKTDNDKFYIGSSKNIKARKYKHKSKSNPDFPSSCKLYQVIQEDGWDNYELEVLEEFEEYNSCTIKHQEQIYISDLKPSLNTRAAFLTAEERREAGRVASALKNRIDVVCECGCSVRKAHIARHKRSFKHKIRIFDINVAATVKSCIDLDLDPLFVLSNIIIGDIADTSAHSPTDTTPDTPTMLDPCNDQTSTTQDTNNQNA